MVENPEHYIEAFAEAGASLITIHPEATRDAAGCLKHIRAHGMQAGLAINPDKPLCLIEEYIQSIDLLLIMSVYPGFAGQSFIETSIEKVSHARQLINNAHAKVMLGIDGGIKSSNIAKVVAAGADFCVIGSGLFHCANYRKQMQEIRAQIHLASSDAAADR